MPQAVGVHKCFVPKNAPKNDISQITVCCVMSQQKPLEDYQTYNQCMSFELVILFFCSRQRRNEEGTGRYMSKRRGLIFFTAT